jgi:hypothetical protein
LRRGIKTKTLFMLLAWMIIFLHSIIPHNHHEHRSINCNYICYFDHGNSAADKIVHYGLILKNAVNNDRCKVFICHFSVELMQETHLDHLFFHESPIPFTDPLLSPVTYIHNCTINKGAKSVIKFMPLRAPPLNPIHPC